MTLVDTPTAAFAVDVRPVYLSRWAALRGLEPVSKERQGRRFLLLWDLDAVFSATSRQPTQEAAAGPSASTLDRLRRASHGEVDGAT